MLSWEVFKYLNFIQQIFVKQGGEFGGDATDATCKSRWWLKKKSTLPEEMIQFDEHVFQMGWLKPPTRNPSLSDFLFPKKSLGFSAPANGPGL